MVCVCVCVPCAVQHLKARLRVAQDTSDGPPTTTTAAGPHTGPGGLARAPSASAFASAFSALASAVGASAEPDAADRRPATGVLPLIGR